MGPSVRSTAFDYRDRRFDSRQRPTPRVTATAANRSSFSKRVANAKKKNTLPISGSMRGGMGNGMGMDMEMERGDVATGMDMERYGDDGWGWEMGNGMGGMGNGWHGK